MKFASIIAVVLALIDAVYLGIWTMIRSSRWSVVVANFESDAGKSEIGNWHLEHVRSVEGELDRVFWHASTIAVSLAIAVVFQVNQNAVRPRSKTQGKE